MAGSIVKSGGVGALAVSVGPVAATVIGASAASASAATIILATGGAAALVLVAYGIYKAASK
jgi:hypothetical protein